MPFIVARTFQMPVWNEETRHQVKDYWQARRMRISEESDRVLKAERSNLLCNLYACDPQKLKASLLITWMEPGVCDCLLSVDTAFQILTEWNKAYFSLELATFESFVAYGNLNGELWERFLRSHDLASFYWCVSGGLLGYHMSKRQRTDYLPKAARRLLCRNAA